MIIRVEINVLCMQSSLPLIDSKCKSEKLKINKNVNNTLRKNNT